MTRGAPDLDMKAAARRSCPGPAGKMRYAALGVVLAAAVVLGGCLGSETRPGAGPDPAGPYVYKWSTDSVIGLDGGARIEIQPPATQCEIKTSIAGWPRESGMEALWLSVSDENDWAYFVDSAPYVRSGAYHTNAWQGALPGGELALEGGGNMSQGGVVYMLAKNLTSWRAITGQEFPALFIEARCDAPGLKVTFARDVLFLHESDMDDGTVVALGRAPFLFEPVVVASGASSEHDLNGSVAMYAMGHPQQNNIQGTLTIEAPDAKRSWEIGPGIFYEHGPAGHYRVDVDRLAVSMTSCREPGAPCGPHNLWWGFIAGFEETDDPDAFFGLADG